MHNNDEIFTNIFQFNQISFIILMYARIQFNIAHYEVPAIFS